MAEGLVVGTAGHIDHGKTSLVHALTGVALDPLPEERDRGITLALHVAPLALDGRQVGFVDVPGHERLVRTMIAGVTGIDAVLLCVSAVDGAMPQTREHLSILQLLGVPAGVVALTMADLVDEEMLELAREDVADTVRGTFLEGAPVVATSTVDGRGLDALRQVLASFTPRPRPADGPFRLPVDRAFSRPGFGTVVTGTTWSGTLPDGATVQLLPGGATARVRGIESHGSAVSAASPGRRTALNLSGIQLEQVPRGTVVAVGEVPCASMLDVRYHHLPGVEPLHDRAPVRVLLGTSERLGHLHLASEGDAVEGGAQVYAQLRLDEPLPCLPGDRFILRRTSPLETLGGGVVLDPWAPRMRSKHRAEAARELARLDAGDRSVFLLRAGELGLSVAEYQARDGVTPQVELGGRAFAPEVVERLDRALRQAMDRYHAERPLLPGAQRRELLRDRLGHLSERVYDALVARGVAAGDLEVDGVLLRRAGFAVEIDAASRALQATVHATIREAGLEGLPPKKLHETHPEPAVLALVRLLERDGRVLEVPAVGWVDVGVRDALAERLRRAFDTDPVLTTASFKDLTQLSRKGAIPWLEWLDAHRWTVRQGDVRHRGPAL